MTWQRLRTGQQLRLARQIADRRVNEWRRRYPNVLSAGAGLRTRAGQIAGASEVCLRFLVRRKWSRPRPEGIPHTMTAYTEIDGQRRRVEVPTDVAPLGRGEATGRFIARGVRARALTSQHSIRGAVCCLVRDDKGQLYLLGCHHVFSLSLRAPSCAPLAATLERQHDGAEVGPVVGRTRLVSPSPRFGLDLALARVDHPGRVSSVLHGREPTRIASGPDEILARFPTYQVVTPRGVLPAGWVSEQRKIGLRYQCGATVRFFRVYESRANTLPGDSGSPLIAADGTLIGMHFYRTSTGKALAIPADVLLEERNFGRRLHLAVGHDL